MHTGRSPDAVAERTAQRWQCAAVLAELAAPDQVDVVDGSCLRWSELVTATLRRVGLPAQTCVLLGWGAGQLLLFGHQATLVGDELIVDYTARQYGEHLPARWLALRAEYLADLTAATGAASVELVAPRKPTG